MTAMLFLPLAALAGITAATTACDADSSEEQCTTKGSSLLQVRSGKLARLSNDENGRDADQIEATVGLPQTAAMNVSLLQEDPAQAPPVASDPSYATKHAGGACYGQYIAAGSGIETDLSACYTKCNGVTSCRFLSFCPGGTSDCKGQNANYCALFSTCTSKAKRPRGYMTYMKETSVGGCPIDCSSGCWNNSKRPQQCLSPATGFHGVTKKSCERKSGTWCPEVDTPAAALIETETEKNDDKWLSARRGDPRR